MTMLPKGTDPERLIVLLGGEIQMSEGVRRLQAAGASLVQPLEGIHGAVISVPGGQTGLLAGASWVRTVEPDRPVRLLRSWCELSRSWLAHKPRGQEIPWGIRRVGAPTVWPRSRGRRIRIGVLDTGCDMDHPNLRRNVKGGINLLGGGDPTDDNGHGTHVAGILAAADDGEGVIGGAPEAELYIVKLFDQSGCGQIVDIVRALQWCIDQKLNVVNMSFGTDLEESTALRMAVQVAHGRGMVLVAAAGNDGYTGPVDFPGRYPEVLAVTASNRQDRCGTFSSRGRGVDLIAPGARILSTAPDGRYRVMSGTSMAAPHVSAAAALLLAAEPDLAPAAIRQRLKQSAEPLKSVPPYVQGAGMCRVDQALGARKTG
jgi:subtilisin